MTLEIDQRDAVDVVAAVVWVQKYARLRTVQTETVALDRIRLHPGGTE